MHRMINTGGEWTVGRNGDGNLAIFSNTKGARVLVAGFSSHTVTEDDARLMAAAPALRAALIELRAEVDEMVRRVGWAGNGARGRADLLISELEIE